VENKVLKRVTLFVLAFTSLASADVVYDLQDSKYIASVNQWNLSYHAFDSFVCELKKYDKNIKSSGVLEGVLRRNALMQKLQEEDKLPTISSDKVNKEYLKLISHLPTLNAQEKQSIFSIVEGKYIEDQYSRKLGVYTPIHDSEAVLNAKAKKVSELEIVNYYKKNAKHFQETDFIKAQHIQLSSHEMAEKALAALDEGMPFDEAVVKFSTAKDKLKTIPGDMGIIHNRDNSLNLVQKIALIAKEKKHTGFFHVNGVWHIYYVRQRATKLAVLDDSVRFIISRKIAKKEIRKAYINEMKTAVKIAKIKVNDKYVKEKILND